MRRLPTISFVAFLLFSSISFAQHHDSSAPPPAPAPSAAPSPAPTFTTSAPSAASSAGAVHSSSPTPSAPPAPSRTETPVAPSFNPSSRSSGPAMSTDSVRVAPGVHSPQSDSQRVVPEQKITGDERINSAPRIGENPPEKTHEPKPVDPNLRRRICEGAACKTQEPEPKPVDSDLRRRVCLSGPCPCSVGQTATKGGCVTAATGQCAPGQIWNGGSCVASTQCPAGQYWNGTRCTPTDECAGIIGQVGPLIAELRSIAARVHEACSQDPSGDECMDLKQEQDAAVQRYRMLLSEAPASCGANLPDPFSVI